MANPVAAWIGDRLPVSGEGLKELTNEPVPWWR